MTTSSNKSIFRKLMDARQAFHAQKLTKSGKNTYAGYDYFELEDILRPGMKAMHDAGLCPIITFGEELALMNIYDMDNPDVTPITISSPMAEAHLKGCHPIQNMGATETYTRRYLWFAALEVVEGDPLDATTGADTDKPGRPTKKPAASKPKKAAKPSKPDTSEEESMGVYDPEIETEEDAETVTDMLIDLATNMHSDSIKSLGGFWKKNKKVIDLLDQQFEDQYKRLKGAFTNLKQSIKENEDD